MFTFQTTNLKATWCKASRTPVKQYHRKGVNLYQVTNQVKQKYLSSLCAKQNESTVNGTLEAWSDSHRYNIAQYVCVATLYPKRSKITIQTDLLTNRWLWISWCNLPLYTVCNFFQLWTRDKRQILLLTVFSNNCVWLWWFVVIQFVRIYLFSFACQDHGMNSWFRDQNCRWRFLAHLPWLESWLVHNTGQVLNHSISEMQSVGFKRTSELGRCNSWHVKHMRMWQSALYDYLMIKQFPNIHCTCMACFAK